MTVAAPSPLPPTTATSASQPCQNSTSQELQAQTLPPQSPVADGDQQDSEDDEDEDQDQEDDQAQGSQDAQDQVQTSGSNLTSKQKKKKKSKAAAKLRKKLGLAPNSQPSLVQQPPSSSTSTPNEKQIASGSINDGKITDQVVSQVQKAVREEHGAQAAARVNKENLAKVMAMMNLERDAVLKGQDSKAKTQKAIADHKFWKTQPVVKPDDGPVLEDGVIEPNHPPEKVRKEPYPLPNDFEWVIMDIDDEKQLKEIYDLLSANYVEDDDASLRFNYSPEFLHWVLKHPGYRKTWHIGVRVTSSQKLVAFISGIPHELRVREQAFHSTEINFLCVHKKLRSKRLAPVLIKEVTRQCHLTGVFQAIYTAGVVIPTPISCSRYYHRTINAKKLLEIGFAAVPHNMSEEAHIKRYELPKETSVVGLREMTSDDVPAVGKLMRRYMRRFDMAPRFNDEEIRHVFLSGRGSETGGKRVGQVTWSYVVENPTTKAITDVFSFYSLPSSILDHPTHKDLNAAYLFYYATDAAFETPTNDPQPEAASSTSASSTSPLARAIAEGVEEWQRSNITGLNEIELEDEKRVTNWQDESPETKKKIKARLNELCRDALIIARDNDFDVVNCLTVMDNPLFLQEQKFGPGDGFLRFYLFNWRIQPIAGGMGSRPGEAEMDPVVLHQRNALKASSGTENYKVTAEEIAKRARRNPSDFGSGNGVVMV